MILNRLNNLLYPYKDNEISLFNKRIKHRLNKYSLKKLEEHFESTSHGEDLSTRKNHLDLIKRTLNPYLYDIIPKYDNDQEQISYNSGDPKINS